jgi:hypothetical protein
MNELRRLYSITIVRGGLLRADGVGVGLVGGGAPPWELMSRGARALAGEGYHRLLLALDAALDVYLVDAPHDVATELGQLTERYERALDEGRQTQAAVLNEIRGYVTDLARHSESRAKQVVWAVAATPGIAAGSRSLARLVPSTSTSASGAQSTGSATVRQAVERARRLADALREIGGTPPARLLEPEEIAALLYRQADPVRAQRYPVTGSLLERVTRVSGPRSERKHQ